MPIGNAPAWKLAGPGLTVQNATGATIAANLFLVADATADNGARVPAAASTVLAFKGVSQSAITNGSWGTVFGNHGDVVEVRASGTVARGDTVAVDTTATKEGRGRTYTTGAAMIAGIAETGGVDGDLIQVYLAPYFKAS